MKIVVEIKNSYGNELIYPVCDTALTFSKLTGKKTLSSNDIRLIKQLGYAIEVKSKSTL